MRLASNMPTDVPIVLIFGAMASGSITVEDHPYVRRHHFNYFTNTLP